jgi:hypothetical protein
VCTTVQPQLLQCKCDMTKLPPWVVADLRATPWPQDQGSAALTAHLSARDELPYRVLGTQGRKHTVPPAVCCTRWPLPGELWASGPALLPYSTCQHTDTLSITVHAAGSAPAFLSLTVRKHTSMEKHTEPPDRPDP